MKTSSIKNFMKADVNEKCKKVIKAYDNLNDRLFDSFHFNNHTRVFLLPTIAHTILLAKGEEGIMTFLDLEDIEENQVRETVNPLNSLSIHVVKDDYYNSFYQSYNRLMIAITSLDEDSNDTKLKYEIVIPERTTKFMSDNEITLLLIAYYYNVVKTTNKVFNFYPKSIREECRDMMPVKSSDLSSIKEEALHWMSEEEYNGAYDRLMHHTSLNIVYRALLAKAFYTV